MFTLCDKECTHEMREFQLSRFLTLLKFMQLKFNLSKLEARLTLSRPRTYTWLMPNQNLTVIKRSKYALIIWTLLTLCCALFWVLPYISVPTKSPVEDSPLPLTLTGLAVLMGASTVFIRYYLFSKTQLALVGKKMTEKYADAATRLFRFQQYWFTFHVIAWGVNESLASFGVMIFATTGDPQTATPFAIAGILLNMLMYPDFPEAAKRAGIKTSD